MRRKSNESKRVWKLQTQGQGYDWGTLASFKSKKAAQKARREFKESFAYQFSIGVGTRIVKKTKHKG